VEIEITLSGSLKYGWLVKSAVSVVISVKEPGDKDCAVVMVLVWGTIGVCLYVRDGVESEVAKYCSSSVEEYLSEAAVLVSLSIEAEVTSPVDEGVDTSSFTEEVELVYTSVLEGDSLCSGTDEVRVSVVDMIALETKHLIFNIITDIFQP